MTVSSICVAGSGVIQRVTGLPPPILQRTPLAWTATVKLENGLMRARHVLIRPGASDVWVIDAGVGESD